MKISIVKYKNLNRFNYIKLLKESDVSTPFHNLSFLLSLDKSMKNISLYFYIVEKNKNYIAVMPFFSYKYIPFSMKSLVYGCYGGFIYLQENEKDLVLFFKKNRFSKLLTEVVSYYDNKFYEQMLYLSKKDLKTWILKIPDNHNDFFKSIHSKTRNQIRKAYKENVVVTKINSKKELEKVQLIYMQLVAKHNIQKPYSLKLFEELFKCSIETNDILFKVAKIEDDIIAFSIFIIGDKDLFYWINASDAKYLKYNGTNAILDSVINYAIKNNIKELNMGAVPVGNDNLLHFKTRWGAIEKIYYSYSTDLFLYLQKLRSKNG